MSMMYICLSVTVVEYDHIVKLKVEIGTWHVSSVSFSYLYVGKPLGYGTMCSFAFYQHVSSGSHVALFQRYLRLFFVQ